MVEWDYAFHFYYFRNSFHLGIDNLIQYSIMVSSKDGKKITKMKKDIEIKLKHKQTGIIKTYLCHCYRADSRAYYLQGVKGFNDPLNIGLAFNKAEWERI